MFEVPVPPPARFSVAGFTTMVRGELLPSTVNGIDAVEVDSGGDALSNAVACAVWLPAARAGLVKLYGALVSVLTRVPSTRNSTRLTDPLSLAVAASAIVAPFAICCPLVGLVRLTLGGELVGVVPPLQAVPLSVNAVGPLLVPLKVPLNPAVKLWPLPML